jgi:hypothetical protein
MEFMKRNCRPINFILLIAIIAGLAFTASDYANCISDYPDEFLDLAAAGNFPVSPVFAPEQNTLYFLFNSLKIDHFSRIHLLTNLLRC